MSSYAMTTAFLLNRAWAFRGSECGPLTSAYASYGLVQTIGALINVVVFTACISLAPALYRAPVVALAIGSVIALGFNFAGTRRLVFKS